MAYTRECKQRKVTMNITQGTLLQATGPIIPTTNVEIEYADKSLVEQECEG